MKAPWKIRAVLSARWDWVCHFISSLPKPRCRIRMLTWNSSLGVWMRINSLKKKKKKSRKFISSRVDFPLIHHHLLILQFTLSILRLLFVFFSLTFRRSLRVMCTGPSFFTGGAWKQNGLEGRLGRARDWALTQSDVLMNPGPKRTRAWNKN